MNGTVAATLLLTLLASGALATESRDTTALDTRNLTDGVLPYEVFEATIEHVDLEGCPGDIDSEANFCRMTLASDLAHVFVFSHDGAQPLIAVRSYELTDGFLPF